MSNEALV